LLSMIARFQPQRHEQILCQKIFFYLLSCVISQALAEPVRAWVKSSIKILMTECKVYKRCSGPD
jgi:hypothetical protein